VWIVATVLLSAIRTVVVPRGERLALVAFVFVGLRRLLTPFVKRMSTEQREQALSRYAPLALMGLAATWSVGVIAGYSLLFWAVSGESVSDAIVVSGSSLTTLGLASIPGLPTQLLSVSEALIGLGLVGLLISFLPTMYSVFNRRELPVAQLATRAGTPPSPTTLLIRLNAIHGLDQLDEMWSEWERWFAELEETHTSYPALVYFRSGQGRSWLTSAGAVLDAAALVAAAVDQPRRPQAMLCIRSGFIALREIASYFNLSFSPDPSPGDPISVRREEFDTCIAELAAAGLPIVPDLDQAWLDFAGWRVNYDQALIGLCSLIGPPEAMWSSDRAPLMNPTVFGAVRSVHSSGRRQRQAQKASGQ